MVHLKLSCFIKYQYILSPQKNFSVKIQLSFQVIILLTNIYISSMSIRHQQSLNCYSSTISNYYANFFLYTVERFFFAETKVLCQENYFDTCYFHHLKSSHTDLLLFHLHNNQLKHTLDSVIVNTLAKVLNS